MDTNSSSDPRLVEEQQQGARRADEEQEQQQQQQDEPRSSSSSSSIAGGATIGDITTMDDIVDQFQTTEDLRKSRVLHQTEEALVIDDGNNREATPASCSSSSILLRGEQSNKNYSVLQQKWIHMFKRLTVFKEKHGHCLVPNRYSEDHALGAWVSTQRRQYKILTSGGSESTPMTVERAGRLEDLGFVWATTDPRHVPWEIRYRELVEFHEKHGDCLVPIGFKENVKLANWVSTQRQEYKLLREGRSSRLTLERIQLLQRANFVWEAQRGGPRKRKKNGEVEDAKKGDTVSPEEPKKATPIKKLKGKERAKAGGPKEVVVASAEFVGLAAHVLPPVMPQHPVLSGSLQHQGTFQRPSGVAPVMHHRQGMNCSDDHQRMIRHPPYHTAVQNPHNILESSYTQNAAAVAAANARQATATAANFLQQAPPYISGYNPASLGGKRNAAIAVYQQTVHQRAGMNTVHSGAIQQNGMTMKNAGQSAQAQHQAQRARAHAMLQQQHAQAAQRAALAVQQQRQAAQALVRFDAATMASSNRLDGPTNPFHTSTLPAMASQIAPFDPSLSQQGVLKSRFNTEASRDRQTEASRDRQHASLMRTLTQQQSPILSLIPQLAGQEGKHIDIFNEENAISITVSAHSHIEPPRTASAFAVKPRSKTAKNPTREKQQTAASVASAVYCNATSAAIIADDDDTGIFDDASDDEDLTVPIRRVAS